MLVPAGEYLTNGPIHLASNLNLHLAEGASIRFGTNPADYLPAVLVPFGQTFHGRDGFTGFMQGFKGAFPDIRISVTNQVATDDQVVSEFTARGTHTGSLQTPAGAIPPTGRTVDFIVCEVMRIKHGRIASLHNYQDAASIMRQLGLMS